MPPEKRIADRTAISGTVSRALSKQKTCWALFLYAFDKNHPMEYDDTLVRQIIECVVVESKEKIKVVFIGGTEIEMTL